MRIHNVVLSAAAAALLAGAALAQEPGERTPPPGYDSQPPGSTSSLFYGGYVGLAFGTVQYVELSPMLGYRFSDDLGAGVGLLYRYRNDGRYDPSVSLTDYGGNVFARYHLGSGIFAQAEYDATSYEYVPDPHSGATARETYSGLLAGFGYTTSVGPGTGVYALVLYDFRYSASNAYNPYNSPVQLRVGVSVGF